MYLPSVICISNQLDLLQGAKTVVPRDCSKLFMTEGDWLIGIAYDEGQFGFPRMKPTIHVVNLWRQILPIGNVCVHRMSLFNY